MLPEQPRINLVSQSVFGLEIIYHGAHNEEEDNRAPNDRAA